MEIFKITRIDIKEASLTKICPADIINIELYRCITLRENKFYVKVTLPYHVSLSIDKKILCTPESTN
jgi:hypothetical protein